LFAALICGTVFLNGCGWLGVEHLSNTDIESESAPAIPFSVKLPDRFKADILIKTEGSPDNIERRYFIARNGTQKLERFGVGEKNEFALLRTKEGGAFRLIPAEKAYIGLDRKKLGSPVDSLSKSFTSRWLNEKRSAEYKDLGLVNGLRKYEVIVEYSFETVIYVYVDEQLKFPVKQEFFTAHEGKPPELAYSVELQNISNTPEKELFEIPDGYEEKKLKTAHY
jgi:hypothetical protein